MAQNNVMNLLQSMSNSAASNVSAPVDGLAWLLRKAGVPVPRNALLGSDWMAERGLTRPVPQGAASLAGETLGLLAPMAAAAKAPQIAGGLLQMGRNALAPRTLNPQTGALLVAPNKTDKRKLAGVMEEMQTLGAPNLRAVWDEDQGAWVALEGSHRIMAAQKLGLTPNLKEVPMRSWLTDHDLYDLPDKISVARAAQYLRDSDYTHNFPDIPRGGR